jgi:hypothetical protein
MQKGRYAVHVDGIAIPGFNSLKEAEDEIKRRPEWQRKGAGATELVGPVEKGTFNSDFPAMESSGCKIATGDSGH